MTLAICCATERGRQVLARMLELRSGDDFVVFSFRESPDEPPFFDAIREVAEGGGARFYEARKMGSPEILDLFEREDFSTLLAVSWRYMIPMSVAEQSTHGAFVIHDSLLPAYRGFSPTVWAIANGETETGATLFRMASDVDSGDIVDQIRVPIGAGEYISEVMKRVTDAYIQLVERHVDSILSGTAPRTPQDHDAASYTCRRLPEDNEIDWNASTDSVFNLIRAVSRPYQGAYTTLRGDRMRIWRASPDSSPQRYVGRIPGRVVEIRKGVGVVVLTGDGSVLVEEVEVEGRDAECAADVVTSLSSHLGG